MWEKGLAGETGRAVHGKPSREGNQLGLAWIGPRQELLARLEAMQLGLNCTIGPC